MSDATHSGRVEWDATLYLMDIGNGAKSANDSIDKNGVQGVGPKAKRVYVTRATLKDLKRRMSVRQLVILGDVSRLGVISGGQLQRLHYAASEASRRQARLDLAEMVRWQVLERLRRTVGGERAGSKGYVYSMGVAGQKLVNPGRTRYRHPWTPGASHLQHALTVSELYVGLRKFETGPDRALVSFDAEPICWRPFTGPGGGRVTLKPDAFALLHLGHFEDRYFVEIDCGTEAGPRISEKAKTYIRYFKSGKEQARTEIFPYVLWVTPTERRAAFLVETLASLEAEHWKLFLVTTSDRAAGLMTNGQDQITNEKEVK
jgi:hypothetical protein